MRLGAARGARERASTRSQRARARLRARGRGRRVCGIDADDHPARSRASSRRAERPPSTAASAPARRSSARSRAGSSTSLNVLTGNLDRAGGAMFTQAPPPARANTRGAAGRGKGVALRPAAEPRARRCPRCSASCRSRASPRRSRRRATGQIRALDHRSPATRCSEHPNGARLDARARVARLHGERRHLPERDDAPRHVILPGLSPLEQPHYDVALCAARGPQRTPTTRRRSSRPPADRPHEWETLLRLAGDRRRARAQTPTSRALDDFVARQQLERGRRCAPARRSPAAIPTRCWPRSRRAAGPSACSTSCCARARTATASARSPTASRSHVSRRARTASTSARSTPRIPEVLRTPSGKIELAPAPIVADVAAPARDGSTAPATTGIGARRPARPPLEQLVDAQPRRTSCAARRAARCCVHPDDAAPPRPRRRRRRRASRSRVGAVERAGRGDRRDHARRRQPAARLGPRRAGHALRVAARARGRQHATSSPTTARSTRCRGTRC